MPEMIFSFGMRVSYAARPRDKHALLLIFIPFHPSLALILSSEHKRWMADTLRGSCVYTLCAWVCAAVREYSFRSSLCFFSPLQWWRFSLIFEPSSYIAIHKQIDASHWIWSHRLHENVNICNDKIRNQFIFAPSGTAFDQHLQKAIFERFGWLNNVPACITLPKSWIVIWVSFSHCFFFSAFFGGGGRDVKSHENR